MTGRWLLDVGTRDKLGDLLWANRGLVLFGSAEDAGGRRAGER